MGFEMLCPVPGVFYNNQYDDVVYEFYFLEMLKILLGRRNSLF